VSARSGTNRGGALLMLGLLAPAWAGAMEWSGHGGLTGRTVDVDGDRSKYRQHLNLHSGVHLEELVVRAHRDDRGQGLAPDRIDIGLYGLGREPFQRMDLRVQAYGRYRFDYQRRESEYRYDNLLIDPAEASIPGSTGGDFHTFDVDRVFDRARLEVAASERATVTLGYDRHRRSGDSTITLSEQREEFVLDKPVDETLQIAEFGFRYLWDTVTVALTERYREYDNDAVTLLPGFSEGSNPAAPGSLDRYRLHRPWRYRGWEHGLKVQARPRLADGRRAEIDLDAIRIDLDGRHRAVESVQGTTFAGAPFTRDRAGGGRLDHETTVLRLRGRYPVSESLRLVGGVSRRELDQRGSLIWDGDEILSDWALTTTALEAGFEVNLAPGVSGAAGWIGERREQRLRGEGEIGAAFDTSTRHDGYFAELTWRASDRLTLRLDAEDASIDGAFTLTSATERSRWRAQARYRFNDAWSMTASHRHGRQHNANSRWTWRDRQTTVRLHRTGPRLSLALGTARIEQDRDVLAPVSNGLRTVIFDIDYAGDARLHDAAATWRLTDALSVGASIHGLRNRGSFAVSRDDFRGHLTFMAPSGYGASLAYRYLDFEEGGLEAFDARIVELSLRRDW
jgi:hypothetical protein